MITTATPTIFTSFDRQLSSFLSRRNAYSLTSRWLIATACLACTPMSVTQVVGLTQMRGCMRIPLRCVPVRQTCCRKAAPVSIHTPCGEWSTIESSQVVIDSCLCTSPSPCLLVAPLFNWTLVGLVGLARSLVIQLGVASVGGLWGRLRLNFYASCSTAARDRLLISVMYSQGVLKRLQQWGTPICFPLRCKVRVLLYSGVQPVRV